MDINIEKFLAESFSDMKNVMCLFQPVHTKFSVRGMNVLLILLITDVDIFSLLSFSPAFPDRKIRGPISVPIAPADVKPGRSL